MTTYDEKLQVPSGKNLIVPSTGEVVEHYGGIVDRIMPDREDFISSIFSEGSNKPIQLVIAEKLGKTPKEVQSYLGQIPIKASEIVKNNRIITIIGAVPWFSGVFMSQKTNELENGYHKMLFKITEFKEIDIPRVNTKTGRKEILTLRRNIIVSTSGKRIASFFASMCEQYGFYDWNNFSINVLLQKDTETNEEEIIPIDPEELGEIEE